MQSQELPYIATYDLTPVSPEAAREYMLQQLAHVQEVTGANIDLLNTAPILDSSMLNLIEPRPEYSKEVFQLVDPSLIVARPFASSHPLGWGSEYEGRKGRIAELANNLRIPEKMERVFNIENNTSQRIKLRSYVGPAGPIYHVEDGTHRVAMAKLLQLSAIPAEVQFAIYPFPITPTFLELDYLEFLKSMGLVEFEDRDGGVLLKSEKLAWARLRNVSDFVKINQVYSRLYPNSLNHVGSMNSDTLLDVSRFRTLYQNFGQVARPEGFEPPTP